MSVLVLQIGLRANVLDGGAYRIPVITKDETDMPYGPKRVRLLDRLTSRVLQEIITDTAGAGSFDYLAYRPQGYTVIACNNRRDNSDLDYPDIEDFLTPEPMP